MIELTIEECQKIIKNSTKSTEIEIVEFKAEHFGDFLGFLGEYYRLIITAIINNNDELKPHENFNNNDQLRAFETVNHNSTNSDSMVNQIQQNGQEITAQIQPQSFQFFVKSLPIKDLRNRRSMLISSGIFRKESKIYEKLLSEFILLDQNPSKPWCPEVYLVRDDLIVFNDLTLENFKVLPDDVVDFEVEYVEATLKSLAAFHSCSLAFEKQRNSKIGDEFEEILFETSIMDIPWFHAGLKTIQKIAEIYFKIEHSEEFYQEMFKITEIMEKSPFNVPKVLCQRDTWKNNLMFKKTDEVQCILIDFQTARYLSLTVDVNMAIILTTRKNHHEKMRLRYLEFYYQNLSQNVENLESLMTFENFLKSSEYHKKVLLVYKAIAVMLTQPPQDLFKEFSEADYRDFASGDRCRLVMKFMEENEFYKECLIEAVEAIVEEYKSQ